MRLCLLGIAAAVLLIGLLKLRFPFNSSSNAEVDSLRTSLNEHITSLNDHINAHASTPKAERGLSDTVSLKDVLDTKELLNARMNSLRASLNELEANELDARIAKLEANLEATSADDEVRQPAPPVSKQIPALELAQAPKQAISGSGECISLTHAGCFRTDNSWNRVRKKESRLTPSLCASLCIYESRRTGKDLSFIALQYGMDCYCGQSYNKLAVLDGARCNLKCGDFTTKCETDSTVSCQRCGGFDANTVYAIGDSLCNIASAVPLLSAVAVAPQKETAQLAWNHWHKWNSKPVSSTNPLIQGERDFKAGLGGTSALRSVECCA
jgi:hypothetical protein